MASHFGKAAVFFNRPATAGNAEEMTNSTAAVMARGRSQGRCGPDTWRAALEFVGRLICSADIGQIQLCAQDQNQSGKIRQVRQALILPFLSAGAPSLRVGLCKRGEVDVYFCCPPCFHSSEPVPLIEHFSSPQSSRKPLSTAHSELYPFVFFCLQNLSNKYGYLPILVP